MFRRLKLRHFVQSLEAERTRLDEQLRNTRQMRAGAEQIADSALAELINFIQFVLLNHRDIVQLIVDIVRAQNPERAALYVRVLAVVLFELCEDLDELFNRDFRERFVSFFPDVAGSDQFRQMCKEFNRFREVSKHTLKDVRNCVMAHREHNVSRQLKLLEALDQNSILDLAMHTKLILAALGIMWIPLSFMASRSGFKRSLVKAVLGSLDLPPNAALEATAPEARHRRRSARSR